MADVTPSPLTPTAFDITPSDTVPIREPYRHLYVGGAGNIAIKNGDGTISLLTAVPVGSRLEFAPSFIMATNTTATLLRGLK